MRHWVLKTLNTARAWVNRLVWARRSMAAYQRHPEPGSPAAKFRENEEIPIRGILWRVVKRVGGPDPVVMLQPMRPTSAAAKLAGAVGKRRRRLLEAEMTRARQAVKDHQIVDRLAGSKGS